jgi:superfamily I DNA/RNA helicase
VAMKNPEVQAGFLSKTREGIQAFVAFFERTRAQLNDESRGSPVSVAPPSAPPRRTKGTESDLTADRPLSDASARPLGAESPPGGRQTGQAATLAMWAQMFLAEIGYPDELRRAEKDAEAAEIRIRNLQDLVDSMDADASLAPLDRLQVFIEDLMLDSDREEEKEAAGDAVTLITMHSCKGLEFPHVYIVGLEEGLLPHSRSKTEGTLDEERRLFYVAITRAMQTLTLSHCSARKKFGQPVPCHPSRFLKELPPQLVEHADDKARQPVAVAAGRNLFAAMRSALE